MNMNNESYEYDEITLEERARIWHDISRGSWACALSAQKKELIKEYLLQSEPVVEGRMINGYYFQVIKPTGDPDSKFYAGWTLKVFRAGTMELIDCLSGYETPGAAWGTVEELIERIKVYDRMNNPPWNRCEIARAARERLKRREDKRRAAYRKSMLDSFKGMDRETLEDEVHDAKSAEAADINNEGRDAQIEYLMG